MHACIFTGSLIYCRPGHKFWFAICILAVSTNQVLLPLNPSRLALHSPVLSVGAIIGYRYICCSRNVNERPPDTIMQDCSLLLLYHEQRFIHNDLMVSICILSLSGTAHLHRGTAYLHNGTGQ